MEFGTECLRRANKLYRLGRKKELIEVFPSSRDDARWHLGAP